MRMLFIHEQLKKGKFPNCRQLSLEMQVNWRTVHRDMNFMRNELRLPIAYDKARHGYFYTKLVSQFPGVTISEAELFALLVAQKAVAHYRGTPYHKPLKTAFEKLTINLDPKEVVHLQNLGEVMDIRVAGPEDLDEENFQVATRAVQQQRPLQFEYRKFATKDFEVRSLHPYQMVCANHRWYVVGHDLRRKKIRVFVLSRMRELEILPGSFERPADFKIGDFLKGSFGIFKGQDDFQVVIDLDRWAADVMRGRRWHESQQVTELPGGEMRIEFHLDNLEEIESWVLSWGAHATIIRPRVLLERVHATAKAVAEACTAALAVEPIIQAKPGITPAKGGSQAGK